MISCRQALSRQGMELGFWRVALRPGKPLMHGRLGAMTLLGLPGNPVSSIVCAILFLVPADSRASGVTPSRAAIRPNPRSSARICPANGDRQDYMRATLVSRRRRAPLSRLLTRCRIRPCSASSRAPMRCLVRAPHAPAAEGRRKLQNHSSSALLLRP